MRKTLIALFCTALLAVNAAHAEALVTILPTIAPDVTITVTEDPYAVDLAGYFANNTFVSEEGESQFPSLTDGEKARVPDLMARYAGGERPQENVVNKAEGVVVGVYPLPPEEFQGESVFVLLPYHALSDEELLEVIDSYAQLGLTFDEEALSWRNCMRGGGIESNRGYAGDEWERVRTLEDLYKRQGLRPEQDFTAIPGDDGLGEIGLDEEEYSGLPGFRLHPCRRMTDEELLRIVQHNIGEDIPDTSAFGQYEGQTREQATAILGMPLSVKLTDEWIGKANQQSVYNDDREVYVANFASADGQYTCAVMLDTATGLIYEAHIDLIPYGSLTYSDLHCDPFDEKWVTLARQYMAGIVADDAAVVSVESRGEVELDGGCGVRMIAAMADGSSYEMTIIFQNEAVNSVEYRAQATTVEQLYAEYRDFFNH